MRLGAILAVMEPDAKTKLLADRARQLADGGFDSLWTVQGIGRGMMIIDPFVALATAALVTEKIELGTAVLQVPLYHPVELAHRVFSLMHLCGDRLSLGIGTGSTRQDFDALGRSYKDRFTAFESSVDQLRHLFAHGDLDQIRLTPWSAVKGGPPLLLGSWGAGVERAASSYDGWIASAMHRDKPAIRDAIVRYRDAGGQRALISTIIVQPDTDTGLLRESLQYYDEIGFDDAILLILHGGPAPARIRQLI
jgi:alkanesulfonate monooxygenase SsuD/methylene tetrahydromethanopterin reductase-like flavin-dependent oxidoreductase (luciferase family)